MVLLLMTSVFSVVNAQDLPPEVKQELQQRNIDQAELEARLARKGIQLRGKSRAEILLLQPQIEAEIEAMEAEQRREAAAEVTSEAAEEIEAAIDNGASVSEAVNEVTNEINNENLPASNIYGHQIFRNKSLKVYRTTENATPPNSYPLKPGDEVAVSIFGASQTDLVLRLDDQGFVRLPNGYKVNLGGVPLGDARLMLTNRLKRLYTFGDGQLMIRVQTARTISVNIFGEVENNGTFTMSSLNTGFNALVAAGGPTERGTVRNIQVIQGDQKTVLDVYEYLLEPTEKSGFFLRNNASIYVPLAEKVITLRGGVERPQLYELRQDESLSDLIKFAGGLRTRAEIENIRVTRYVNGALELFNVNLSLEPDFELLHEDVVNIPIIENPIENFITIEGAVLLPGRYPFREGVKLQDLIDNGRLRPGARTDAVFLFRNNDDGTDRLVRLDLTEGDITSSFELKRGDRVQILSKRSFIDAATFTVNGAVRDSSVTLPFPQDGALTLDEAILLAGGAETNAASEVMLIRTPRSNRDKKVYQRLDLQADMDFALQPFDRILVYTQERFSDQLAVSIDGAVRAPGRFIYDPSLTLNDLVYLAGGERLDADRGRVEVFRLVISSGQKTRTLLTTIDLEKDGEFTLKPFDEVVVRSAAEFERIQNVVVVGEVQYPGTYAILSDNEKLTQIIQRAGGLTEEAFPAGATMNRSRDDVGLVVLDLDKVMLNPTLEGNVTLINRDTIFIPKRNDLVTIYTANTLANRFGVDSTAIGGTIQVAYQGPKSAKWYIQNYAGGFNNDTARKRWTTVTYPNGGVKETNSFLLVNDYPTIKPGSSIRVGSAPPKQQKQRREERFDWLQLASIITGAATTIVTLVLIRG